MDESKNSVLQEELVDIAKNINELQYLNNKTIVITGATGFIGSVLCNSILCANRLYGCNITVYAVVRNILKAENIFQNVLDRQELKIIKCDFLDNKRIEIEYDVDYIVHTAAVTTSKLMVEKPVDTLMIAINGTNKMLELAREKSASSVVFISSMEVYGSFDKEEYVDENKYGKIDILDVRSSYSEGKRICENICVSYNHQFGIPVKIARLAQTFGPGISKDDNRVYAQFAKSVIEGKDLILHTKGLSEGNYVYISDAIDAILKVLKSGEDGEAYNISNEESHMQIREMAELVAENVAGGNIKVIYEIQSQNAYAKDTKMKMNSSKMINIGWKPQVSLYDTYIKMISYIREML